jgi:hypothetical protein
MTSFAIGTNESESVTVTVLGYTWPASGEFHDDNWLSCEVTVRADVFRGKFPAHLMTTEIDGLFQGLRALYHELEGEYVFEPLEHQLVLRVVCDATGHLNVRITVTHDAGSETRLRFTLSIDQTELAESLRQVSAVLKAFPIKR